MYRNDPSVLERYNKNLIDNLFAKITAFTRTPVGSLFEKNLPLVNTRQVVSVYLKRQMGLGFKTGSNIHFQFAVHSFFPIILKSIVFHYRDRQDLPQLANNYIMSLLLPGLH